MNPNKNPNASCQLWALNFSLLARIMPLARIPRVEIHDLIVFNARHNFSRIFCHGWSHFRSSFSTQAPSLQSSTRGCTVQFLFKNKKIRAMVNYQ